MPTADATILPPPFSSSAGDEPHSARSLEAVGVETVLGAMIEQRRASQPAFASVVVPVLELSDDDDLDENASPNGAPDDGPPHGAADVGRRVPAASDVFLKAR